MTTALALRDEAVELAALRGAVGDLEIYCYETWEFDNRLTKDAARRLVVIAENFDWDMPWVEEMREWSR